MKTDFKKTYPPRRFSRGPNNFSRGPNNNRSDRNEVVVNEIPIKDAKENEIRTVVLGGVGEIGKNMYVVECNKEAVLLECGTGFAESLTPGIDTLLPDMKYLKDNKDKIKAIVLSDSSLKHIGGVAEVLKEVGNVPIYCRKLTGKIVENMQKSRRQRTVLDIRDIEEEVLIKLTENTSLTFFAAKESTPSKLGVIIDFPVGSVAYTGNLKVEHKKGVVSADEDKHYEIFKDKEIRLTLSNSVNSERQGFPATDKDIVEDIKKMMTEANKRVIMPLLPSQSKRNCMIIDEALKLGKKIYIQGEQLLNTLDSAVELSLTKLPKEGLVPIEEILKEEDDPSKVLILLTGEENENYASLESIGDGTNRFVQVFENDTVIFPAPIIPTNSRTTQNLKDVLSQKGAIIRSYSTSDVKGSSHPSKDELKWIHRKINSDFFIPVHGYHYMLNANAHIFNEIGKSFDSVSIPENGSVIDISADGNNITQREYKAHVGQIAFDGAVRSAINEIVIRDRKTLAKEGVFIIITFLDQKKLILKKSPDIISRGFIYLRESQDLISQTRLFVKKVIEKELDEVGSIEIDTMKKKLQKKIQNFLVSETNKKPIVILVVFT